MECQKLCDNHDGVSDHWYLEYEADCFKCYLKKAYQGKDDHCHEASSATTREMGNATLRRLQRRQEICQGGVCQLGGPKPALRLTGAVHQR